MRVADCASQIGSGALPLSTVPSAGLSIVPNDGSGSALAALAEALRQLPLPIIGRIEKGRWSSICAVSTMKAVFCVICRPLRRAGHDRRHGGPYRPRQDLAGARTDQGRYGSAERRKERGISIDLGFAYLPLSGEDRQILGFVDVPGHEKFVHTMLAGAASIDFVMLVVAADDGIMPQTREHLSIVNLLGIRRGIAVITKSDLAGPERLAEVKAAIRNELAPTGLADIPILTVSTLTGAGIGELQAVLETQARAFGERHAEGGFRLPWTVLSP